MNKVSSFVYRKVVMYPVRTLLYEVLEEPKNLL